MLCDPQSWCHHGAHRLARCWVGMLLVRKTSAEQDHTQMSWHRTVGVKPQSAHVAPGIHKVPPQN
jgi:hypothetical protein